MFYIPHRRGSEENDGALLQRRAKKQEEAQEDELLQHARFKTGHTSKAKSIRPAGGTVNNAEPMNSKLSR